MVFWDCLQGECGCNGGRGLGKRKVYTQWEAFGLLSYHVMPHCVCVCVCVCVLLQVLVTGPFAEVPLGWSCVECPVPPGTKGHPSAGGRWPAGTGGLHGRG